MALLPAALPARDTGEAIVVRARWLGAALTLLQLILYVPTEGVVVPYSVWWGAVPAALFVLVNVVTLLGGRYRPAPRAWAVVGLVGDSVAILVLIGAFAFDAASALWTLLVLPVAEASIRRWARGALITWVSLAVLYTVQLQVLHVTTGTPMLTVDSLSYRIGLLGIVAFALAGLTRRLNDQTASARASQAEADQLRAVAAATRRMSSLDVPTVIREVTHAAEQLGCLEAQMWSRSGQLARAGRAADGLGLTGVRFDELAAATRDRGWAVLGHDAVPDALGPDEALVVAGVQTGDSVEALLVGRYAAPVTERTAEGLSLLATQASAALANALRYEEGRAFEERLAHQANHDDLTGLPNRAMLGEKGRQCLLHDRRRDRLVAVLFLDLDRFKQVNDVLGHATGDGLLRQVAQRIADPVRPEDVCARVGGDECVVVSGGHTSVLTMLALAYRLRSAIHRPFTVGELTLDVEVSVGVSWAPADGDDIDLLLQRADVAMYAAKRAHAGVTLYRDVSGEEDATRLTVLGDLRRALDDEDQLEVHFQPIVTAGPGRPVAFEALLRWNHPTRGEVMPGTFIPVAEGTSIIHQLTDVVLDRALAALARWHADGRDVRVAVNLSPRALVDVSLIQRVDALLAAHHVAPDRLCLEITEDTLVEDPTRAIATMHRLTELGVRLSIDDFGTGYSSMSYLKSLPVHGIKIDRTFVTDMLDSVRDGSLVHSVVDLAHRLQLEVVAEGVEDAPTLVALAEAGCDFAQGFHISRPMPEAEVAQWWECWQAGDHPVGAPGRSAGR